MRAAYGANQANAGSVYSLLLWMVACFTCGCCAIVPTPIKIDECPIFLPPAHSFAMPLLLFGRRILLPFATFHFLAGVCYRPLPLPIAPFHFWPAHPIAQCPFSLLAGAFGTPRDSHNLAGTLTVDCCMLRRHHCFSFSRHDLMPCYLAAVPPSIHPITSITTPASISIIAFLLGSSSDYGWHLCVR